MEKGFSRITVRETGEEKVVRIGAGQKPDISPAIREKWQSLIDSVARIINIPAGLIMQLQEDTINVFLKSETEGNPYEEGESAELIYGLYCENVIGKQEKLFVQNAKNDPLWSMNNPDISLDMVSYLGYPINWPDGDVFGTVCILDNKDDFYSKEVEDLLAQVKNFIESDLELIMKNIELSESRNQLEELNSIKSKFLAMISHDVRGNIGGVSSLLDLIINHYETFEKEEMLHNLSVVKKYTDSAFTTLEDLLKWSKKGLLNLEPNKKDFDIVRLTRDIISSQGQQLSLKKIVITGNFTPNSIIVHADEDMMASSLRNILSNAAKYTDPGGKIDVTISSEGMKKCTIIIEDNGQGMDDETKKKLFHYTDSEKKTGTSGEKSSGMGLFLIREFLEKNTRSFHVESEPGQGTRFIIIM